MGDEMEQERQKANNRERASDIEVQMSGSTNQT
jgi:hypothetical protein